MSDPDRYKSRGRKERTPEQLKVLEMAREKARLTKKKFNAFCNSISISYS